MASIEYVTIEADDWQTADSFYSEALQLGDRLRVQTSNAPTTGFRGFVLGLVVSQPSLVDNLTDRVLQADAT